MWDNVNVDRITAMLAEASRSAGVLTGCYRHELKAALTRAMALVQTRSPHRSGIGLLVGSAGHHVHRVEQRIRALLHGDDQDALRDLHELYRTRDLCTDILLEINQARPARREG
jgi:hypothetical protein